MPIDNVKLTLHIAEPDLDAEEQDEAARRLLAQLRELDEVESAERVLDLNPPPGNKAMGGFLPGAVRAEVKPTNVRSLFGFLRDRSSYSPIEIEVEVGERKVRVKANSQEDLSAALQVVQQLMAGSTPAAPTRTILILAANSKDSVRLRLDEEVRDIDEGLRRSQFRDRFRLKPQWAVHPRDIQRSLLDHNPQIVHFCGHGHGTSSSLDPVPDAARKLVPLNAPTAVEEAGLVFEDETGSMKLVSGVALAGLFRLFADQVECVVLNACYSEVQATAIAQHIPYVIGMSRAIGDRAAIEFAVGFYDALGAGRSIEFAYDLACSAIQMAGIPEHLTPVLKKGS